MKGVEEFFSVVNCISHFDNVSRLTESPRVIKCQQNLLLMQCMNIVLVDFLCCS